MKTGQSSTPKAAAPAPDSAVAIDEIEECLRIFARLPKERKEHFLQWLKDQLAEEGLRS